MTGERKALEARVEKNILALNNLIGRGTRIRTADLQYPKLPRYQAALYPGTAMSIHAKGTSSKARGRQIGRARRAPDASSGSDRSVRGETWRARFRVDFGRHHSLGARPEPNQHILAGAQFRHAKPAQCFHVHKDIRRAVAASQEAKSAQTVEPLDLGALEPAGRRHSDMGARRQHLSRVDRRRFVHR